MFSHPLLALDTAAGATVCLRLPDGSVHTDTMTTPRAHSRELLPLLQRLLQKNKLTWHDIGAFAVGVGPGSFTGLRVACATIAGINASLKRPVFPLCSLSLLARQAMLSTPLWAIEDARSGLVYAAQYADGETLVAPHCMPWETLLSMDSAAYISASNLPVSLDGWQALSIACNREQALAAAVEALSAQQPSPMPWVEPVYLQPSQAERNLKP